MSLSNRNGMIVRILLYIFAGINLKYMLLVVQSQEMSNCSDIMDLLEGCDFAVNTNWQTLLYKLDLTVDDVRGLKKDSLMEGTKEALYRGLDTVIRRKKKTWHDLIFAIKKIEPRTAEKLMKLRLQAGI